MKKWTFDNLVDPSGKRIVYEVPDDTIKKEELEEIAKKAAFAARQLRKIFRKN